MQYLQANFNDLQKHLTKCYDSTKNQLSKEMQQLIRKIIAEEGSQIQKPQTGGQGMKLIILAVALLVAIIVIAWVIYTKRKPGKNEPVSTILHPNNSNIPKTAFTSNDKDMLELIHLLATITNKTDAFLNK